VIDGNGIITSEANYPFDKANVLEETIMACKRLATAKRYAVRPSGVARYGSAAGNAGSEQPFLVPA